jgi:hypothetical protein
MDAPSINDYESLIPTLRSADSIGLRKSAGQ